MRICEQTRMKDQFKSEKWDKQDAKTAKNANRLYSVVFNLKVIKGDVVFRKHDQFSFTACLKRTNLLSTEE